MTASISSKTQKNHGWKNGQSDYIMKQMFWAQEEKKKNMINFKIVECF